MCVGEVLSVSFHFIEMVRTCTKMAIHKEPYEAEGHNMETIECYNTKTYEKPSKTFGMRHLQMFLCFLLLTIGYGMRLNLSVGINAMTDRNTSKNPDVPTYNWTNKSIILSSFFWGYIWLQVFAGKFAENYGPKWFLAGAMLVNSLICFLIPLMAEKFGSNGMMGCRIVQGLFQGFFIPSTHALLGKWVPPAERSSFGTFVYSGPSLGTIITLPITGVISASWLGWPSSFYLYGILGAIWLVLWSILGSNSPAVHRSMSEEERNYIIHSLGSSNTNKNYPTPWKSIFTSKPVWAIIIVSIAHHWAYTMLGLEIPSYMRGVLEFDISKDGFLSAAPYLAFLILSFIVGPIADAVINRGIATRCTVRKIANTIGTWVPAIALAILGFLGKEHSILCVILLIIIVGISAAVFCGSQVNHIDLSPNHAGTLMGITNSSSNIFSILAPVLVQFIVGNDIGDKTKWRTIFLTASAAFAVCNLFYILFASAEIQPWNYIEEKHVDAIAANDIIVEGKYIQCRESKINDIK